MSERFLRDRLPTDLRQAARIMAEVGVFETGQGILTDAANQIEALTAERDALQAKVERLEDKLLLERLETLWNAYHTGSEKDGKWDHCCMSDGEWLARECGFDPRDRVFDAAAIKDAIPAAARAALGEGE